jgi:hypothetical protein
MELETPLKASTNNTFNKSIVPPSTVARKHMTKRKRLEDAIASLRLDGNLCALALIMSLQVRRR